MIPRILHHIWLGPDPLPEQFAQYVETWRQHHPAWELHLWTEGTLPPDLERREVYERLRMPAERSDILRLELLWRLGGVYVDTDFECLRPIDPLLDGVDLFAAYFKYDPAAGEERINNAIVGAVPQHPVLRRALDEIRPQDVHGFSKHVAGPFFLDRIFKGGGATLLPRKLFYPAWTERDEAVAYHHMARSWKDDRGLLKSASLARNRVRRAEWELEGLDHRLRQLRGEVSPVDEVVFRNSRRIRHLSRRGVDQARRATRRGGSLLEPRAERARARLARGRRSDTAVARVIHHVWLGADPLPDATRTRIETWRVAHPDWQLRLWTEDSLPDGLRPEVYELLRSPAERADLLRLELLLRQGGVVVDPELACRGRIDRIVGDSTCFAARAPDGGPSTAVVGATAGHPTVARALEEARPRAFHGNSGEATGAGALARAAAAGCALDLLPLDPRRPQIVDRAALVEEILANERRRDEVEALVARRRSEIAGLEELP